MNILKTMPEYRSDLFVVVKEKTCLYSINGILSITSPQNLSTTSCACGELATSIIIPFILRQLCGRIVKSCRSCFHGGRRTQSFARCIGVISQKLDCLSKIRARITALYDHPVLEHRALQVRRRGTEMYF